MQVDPSFSDSHAIKRRRRHDLEPEARSIKAEEPTNSQGSAGCPESNFIPNGDNDDEGPSTFPGASKQDISNGEKIYPLSGKPFFSCIMSKSQVHCPCQLGPPKYFWPFLPNACVPATLCTGTKSWKLTYFGNRRQRRFDVGWKSFMMDNNLKMGDGCVFELMDEKNLIFQVQILRCDIPPEFINSGVVSDKPLLIE